MSNLRPTTQQRRQRILDIATEVFCEFGYDGASMSTIATKVGGSKGTLYNYFPSKDDLLLSVILNEAELFHQTIMHELDISPPVERLLFDIVRRSVNKFYVDPKTTQLLRVVISVGNTTDIGQRFFAVLGEGIWEKVRLLLIEKIRVGELKSKDPEMMTTYLRGLCEVDMLRLLMGAMPNFTAQQAEERACYIVRSFLQAYSTQSL